jgi:hypothetical protein
LLKGKSRKTFDIIVTKKSVSFKFGSGHLVRAAALQLPLLGAALLKQT